MPRFLRHSAVAHGTRSRLGPTCILQQRATPPLQIEYLMSVSSDFFQARNVCEGHNIKWNTQPLPCGHSFRRLWTKVRQIYHAWSGEIAVCKAVFHLTIYCLIPGTFAIKFRCCPKFVQIMMFLCPIFFGGGEWVSGPNFWPNFINSGHRRTWHVSKFDDHRPSDFGPRLGAENKIKINQRQH